MRIGIIIAILYGLFHVLQLVLQAAAKRKEQERIRLEAERRRLASGQMSSPKTLAGTDDGTGTGDIQPRVGPAPAPQPIRAGRPGDDLAARRRAQLEELRTKREGRRIATPSTPARPVQSGPLSRSTQTPSIPPRVGREERIRIELEQQRLRRENEARRKLMDVQASTRPKDAEQAKLAEERARRQLQEQQAAMAVSAPAAATRQSVTSAASVVRSVKSPSKAAIIELLRTPNSMRQALILKELLDRPLALRIP